MEVVQTTHQGHARQIMNTRPNLPDIVVVVSGDGLVHEVVSGLLSRPDAREVGPTVQICHIAAGSSNGLASSLGTESEASAVRHSK